MKSQEIIYLLIGIVWFVGTIIKKSQKKQTNSPTAKKDIEVKDILQELFGGDAAPQPKPVFETPPTFVNQTPYFEDEQIKEEPAYVFQGNDSLEKINSETSLYTPIANEVENLKIISNNNKPHFLFQRADLQRAVLFSEILKRPEY